MLCLLSDLNFSCFKMTSHLRSLLWFASSAQTQKTIFQKCSDGPSVGYGMQSKNKARKKKHRLKYSTRYSCSTFHDIFWNSLWGHLLFKQHMSSYFNLFLLRFISVTCSRYPITVPLCFRQLFTILLLHVQNIHYDTSRWSGKE